ncbi:SphA family protein, partial [Pseudomonas meliae]
LSTPSKQDLDYQVAVTQLSYLSNVRLGNASLGLNAVLPVVTRMKVDDGLNNAALRGQTGMGDLLIGPFIQFDPVMGPAGPRFVQRIELQVNLPTGEYDDKHAINPGNNAWSFNPYWAATYWFTPKWTASVRAHYLYNGKNDDPAQSFGNVSDIQAGQALHANFATEYAVTDQLRLGINGYWLKQITDTQVDGHDVSGRREKVWAIGPGAMYSFSQNDHVFVNAYFEQDVENRPDGSRVQMRYVHHF